MGVQEILFYFFGSKRDVLVLATLRYIFLRVCHLQNEVWIYWTESKAYLGIKKDITSYCVRYQKRICNINTKTIHYPVLIKQILINSTSYFSVLFLSFFGQYGISRRVIYLGLVCVILILIKYFDCPCVHSLFHL